MKTRITAQNGRLLTLEGIDRPVWSSQEFLDLALSGANHKLNDFNRRLLVGSDVDVIVEERAAGTSYVDSNGVTKQREKDTLNLQSISIISLRVPTMDEMTFERFQQELQHDEKPVYAKKEVLTSFRKSVIASDEPADEPKPGAKVKAVLAANETP